MLVSLKVVKYKLVDISSTPSIVKKVNDINFKGYMDDNLKKLMNKDPRCVEVIFDSFKLEKMKTEEPFILFT